MSASMSTPAVDSKTPLSKFVRRASRLLKSRSSSTTDIGTVAPAAESKTVSIRQVPTAKPEFTSSSYLKQREDKARALFEKYGMTLAAEEWTSPSLGKTEWVQKSIHMRVHRQCHRCQTLYGREKICNQCQHTRCKKCPRYPVKGEKVVVKNYDIDYSVLVDPAHTKAVKISPKTLTLETKSGREAVRKQPTQRVRRTCHKCEKLFVGKALVCEGCQHPRCPQCPRDPPKLAKWPNGYPGDVVEKFEPVERVRKPVRLRYRWECHTCNAAFIEHEKTCRGCGHQRCDDCPRKPPKKVKKETPEEIIQSVEDKLKVLSV